LPQKYFRFSENNPKNAKPSSCACIRNRFVA
jgi:hypothetical protein